MRTALVWVAFMTAGVCGLSAEDWPEYRGKGRLGVWNETGILEKFPEGGLKVLWRTPIKAGYAGPAVADGRVFVSDFNRTDGMRGVERALALDEKTGRILWTHEWPADYRGISWDVGTGVTSHDPVTGKIYWRQPYKVAGAMTVAVPIKSGPHLFLTTFYDGPLMLTLDDKKPRVQTLWKGKSDSEIQTDGLHAVLTTPVIDGDYIYGICSYGQLRCLNLKTGTRIWESMELTKEKARWASGFIVRHSDGYFINNDRGELIIAKLSPEGYREV